MKYVIKKSSIYEETEVDIKCCHMDDEVKNLIKYIDGMTHYLICKKDHVNYSILFCHIYYIESVDHQTFVYTKEDCFQTKHPLYELEEILKNSSCMRISKSTILNLSYLKSVKSLFNGKYEVTLENNEKLLISRRYVSDFKKKFGL